MVTRTISGTCHHEVNLARVNSFTNIFLLASTLTQLFSGYNMEFELNISRFVPDTLIFSKIGRMVICPVRMTYNHVSIFLCSRTKKDFNLPSRGTIAIDEFLYLFRIAPLNRKFQFLSRICHMVTSTISGTCHHEVNTARVITHSTIFLSKCRF